jgi:uncharacterized membrane protein YgaE (UPF0421/DUF939 family)
MLVFVTISFITLLICRCLSLYFFNDIDEICNIKQHYEGEMSSMKERVEAYESFTKKRMEAYESLLKCVLKQQNLYLCEDDVYNMMILMACFTTHHSSTSTHVLEKV